MKPRRKRKSLLRRKIQGIRHWLVYAGLMCAERLLRLLPDRSAVQLGATLGGLVYFLAPSLRRRMLDNLALAYGNEKDEAERKRIAREVLRNCGRMAAEITQMNQWSAEDLNRKVTFEGPEELPRLLREGRPLVIVSGHFGNWEIVPTYGSRCLDAKVLAVTRGMSNPYFREFSALRRRKAGFEDFPRDGDARELMNRIRAGKLLAALVDQDTRKGQTIFVPFFGRPANTTRGPAFIAYRLNIPVYVAACIRNPDGITHTLRIDPAIPARTGLARDADIERIVAQYTAAVEKYVRLHPEQWMWMHARWKRKPEDAPFRRRRRKRKKKDPAAGA